MGKTVGKVLGIAAIAVGIVALTLTGVGLVVGPVAMAGVTAALGGITAAMLSVAATVLSIGASLLSPHPKAPGVNAATTDRLNITLDPRTGRKAVFGNTALGTDLRDQEIEDPVAGTTDDVRVHRFVVCAAHRVQSIDEIWFEDKVVWTAGGGVVSELAEFLSVTTRTEGSAANAINIGARMGTSRRYTGCAYVYFAFYINESSPFAGSIPQRVTIRGKAMPTYDPRKDSTVAGGSGTQRANDCTTWQYDVGGNLQGENCALQLLSYLLGWFIVNPSTAARVLSVGCGIPQARLDMPSFIAAANACDETVTLAAGGSERRYRAAGITSENDDRLATVDRFKAAMNATLDDVDGKIRLTIIVNDLGAPVADFTENDVINEFTWKPTDNLTAGFNIVRGNYVNPSDVALYQMTEYPQVKLASLDGIDRIDSFDLSMVQSQSQAERLAKTRLQRAQYPGMFQATFQITAWRVQKGDPVRLTFGPLGFLNKLFRVLELEHRADALCPMTLREENAAIYAWSNNDSAVVVPAAPMLYSAANTPWQKMIDGRLPIPGVGTTDANMLKDEQFGSGWTRSTLAGFKRVRGSLTSAAFPFPASVPYIGEVALGAGAAMSATSKEVLQVSGYVGRLLYFRVRVARSVGATGTVNIALTCNFKNAAGTNIGSGLSATKAASAVTADGHYYDFIASMTVPAGAVTIDSFKVNVPSNAATGTLRFARPWISDKQPSADVTQQITGTPSDTLNYDYTGAAEAGELPAAYVYKLVTQSGEITAGVTWTYKVAAGTVNTFTSASGVKSMTGTGYGTLTVNSLDTATADVDIFAAYNGQTIGPFRTHLARNTAAAPSGTGGGSGGGASSQSSGFGGYSTTTFVAVSALTYTMPTGKTTAILSANLVGRPGTGGSAGTWTSQGKWQKESSPGSGTWADVTASVVTDDATVSDIGTPGEPQNSVTDTAALVLNVNSTGLTAGTTYSFRFVARVSAGGTKSHSVTGTASVTS